MKNKKGSWIVRMICEVEKEIICQDCTEQEAREMPFSYAVEETEIDMKDFTVKSVDANE